MDHQQFDYKIDQKKNYLSHKCHIISFVTVVPLLFWNGPGENIISSFFHFDPKITISQKFEYYSKNNKIIIQHIIANWYLCNYICINK